MAIDTKFRELEPCMWKAPRSEIQLMYSFMKYDYEKLILPSFREFYKLSIDI